MVEVAELSGVLLGLDDPGGKASGGRLNGHLGWVSQAGGRGEMKGT